MNILAYDNSRYLVNIDNMTDYVYIVDIKLKVICGYDNVHKIIKFGNYSKYTEKNEKIKSKIIQSILLKNDVV